MQILFVEDDAMNRRVVHDMLQVGGVEMTEAVDAEAGLALISDRDFDIILMDLRMPGMDGLTAIGHIRSRLDAKAEVPIIVITADTAVSLRADCIASGADALLLKPVAMQELFDTIGQVLVARSGTNAVLV